MKIEIELNESVINEMVSTRVANALLMELDRDARRAQVNAIMGPVLERFREAAKEAVASAKMGDGQTVEQYITGLLQAAPSPGQYDQRTKLRRTIDEQIAKYADAIFEDLARPYVEKIRDELMKRIDEAVGGR
jgi:DNA-binding ferritin-like protein (Dps family)